MSSLWSIVTFGRCVWARKSRDNQLATFRRHHLRHVVVGIVGDCLVCIEYCVGAQDIS